MSGPEHRPALWSAAEASEAAGAVMTGPRDETLSGIEIDSRLVTPGDLFVALRGETRDGHAFVSKAFEKGAAAALVSDDAGDMPQGACLLKVADTLQALTDMGVARRRRVDAKICAVTGSAGKTGTKEMLRLCLESDGPTHASVKSFNNHLGVPLTLARMPRETRYGVFEIGMNHAGEITPLTHLVRPHVAVVTTVAPVHMEFFDSIESIAEAKAEIFSGFEPGSTAIINRDIPHFELLRARARERGAERIIGFGRHESASARALSVEESAEGSTVDADILGTRLTYRIGTPGAHIVQNSLAVLAAVASLGADLGNAAAVLCDVRPPAGRGRRHEIRFGDGGRLTVIDESYNANPASMAAALATLGKSEGRRVAVLGDMLELGTGGPDFHAGLAAEIERAGVDQVFCAGPLMVHLWDALPPARRGGHAPSSRELAPVLVDALRPGDKVMVKGSLGSAMKVIVDEILARQGKSLHGEASGQDGDIR